MAFTSGNDTRAYSNTGSIGTPAYTALNCEMSSTVSGTADYIETTGKCSSKWKTGEAGTKSWTITGNGHYTAGDAGVDEVRDHFIAGEALLFQWKTLNSEVYSGDTVVTGFTVTSDFNGVVDFDFTAEGTGAISVA